MSDINEIHNTNEAPLNDSESVTGFKTPTGESQESQAEPFDESAENADNTIETDSTANADSTADADSNADKDNTDTEDNVPDITNDDNGEVNVEETTEVPSEGEADKGRRIWRDC